jgi:hypothetical protein
VTAGYVASPLRRARRTKAEIDTLRDVLLEIVDAQKPMTVRQVFYRGVGLALWDKTEAEYQNVVCRLLGEMRRAGAMPFGWIADSTRWMRKPRTFDSMEQALRYTAETYRRALWHAQDSYVEVWLEKEALAGVLIDVTEPWDVPLMVTRGYPSLTFVHSAAATISREAVRGPTGVRSASSISVTVIRPAMTLPARSKKTSPRCRASTSTSCGSRSPRTR